jgi:hypothetical protein
VQRRPQRSEPSGEVFFGGGGLVRLVAFDWPKGFQQLFCFGQVGSFADLQREIPMRDTIKPQYDEIPSRR